MSIEIQALRDTGRSQGQRGADGNKRGLRSNGVGGDVKGLETSEHPVSLVDIVHVFLKIGAMSYGGPAIVGIMETEIQERRNWITKRGFIEGLALVNMLPGPLVTQLLMMLSILPLLRKIGISSG